MTDQSGGLMNRALLGAVLESLLETNPPEGGWRKRRGSSLSPRKWIGFALPRRALSHLASGARGRVICVDEYLLRRLRLDFQITGFVLF